MIVYLLDNKGNIDRDYLKNFTIVTLPDIPKHVLPHTNIVSMEQFGIPLTKLEVDYFNSNYNVWIDFLKRQDEVCLILDDYNDFINNSGNLYLDTKNIQDNELIFPYHPFTDKSSALDITYTYGLRMDTSAYYINKVTARTLLLQHCIERSLDEFFIYISNRNLIEINILPQKFNMPADKEKYTSDRNINKLKTIFSIDFWPKGTKTEIFETLRYVFEVANNLNVPAFLSDGSLLGYVRHNDIMKWDDDVDIMMDNDYIQKVVSKIENDNIYRVTKHIWLGKTLYYKVWSPKGIEIPGHIHRFPFIDIWTYTHKNLEISFSYREPISSQIVFPLKITHFNKIKVNIPNKPLEYLDKLFSDWRVSIRVYSWNHQTETSSNCLLQASIETDSEGKIIIEDNLMVDPII